MRNTVPASYTAVPISVTTTIGHDHRNHRSRSRNPLGHLRRTAGHVTGITGHVGPEYSAIEGLGWKNKTPFHKNEPLKEAIDRVEKKWFGGPDKQIVEAVNAALDRSQKAVQRTSAESNRMASKVSELEAEVRMLRKLVRAYEEQRDLIARGVPGFELP